MKSIHDFGRTVFSFALVLLLGTVFNCPPSFGADLIVLRNLKIITDLRVSSFDEDGLRLDDGSSLTWDEVEKATLSPESQHAAGTQAALDKLLTELGGDLYRIRQRLSTGDYLGLLPHAEEVYERFASRGSNTAYMVKQSLMWGRLAAGRREAAIEPFLRCLSHLRARGGTKVELPGERRMRIDPRTGLTPDLVPIWFDAQSARENLPEVFERIAKMPQPRPDGVYVYYATLALAAGDEAAAARVLNAIQSNQATITELVAIVGAQREIMNQQTGPATAALTDLRAGISAENRPLALYWLGMGQLGRPDEQQRRNGALELLRIPALHGRESPELAGAALFRVMEVLSAAGDARGSVAIRRELLERYGQTYFAAQLKAAPVKAGSAVTNGIEESS